MPVVHSLDAWHLFEPSLHQHEWIEHGLIERAKYWHGNGAGR